MKKYRNLTVEEVGRLREQGCISEDWNRILVTEGFSAGNIIRVRFSGDIKIGNCCCDVTDHDGITRHAGIYNAELIDCTVGDNAFISNIGSYIANYNIGDGVLIENVGKIVCRGESTFGNGVQVSTINEAGGREVPIFNGLSAQTAYMIAMYRHRPKAIRALCSFIDKYCESVRSSRGTIGNCVRISNCQIIQDVNFGEHAVVDGPDAMTNGTVGSSRDQQTFLGPGVIMHDFITTPGALITGGTSLYRCFIGEGCKLDHGFTANDSLFFSNSHFGCGETASIFAGPYTVSHHKASLLIAGYFLFFNAGSGTNQSNHLFKTGAVHQGIHERGTKFGSNAYVMLPAREGAYTAILGKHFAHHNTENFPYSLLKEEDGRSYLHPGVNIASYGTKRDIEKWPRRDGRGTQALDRINFEEYNPYIGQKLIAAVKQCRMMLTKEGIEVHNYHRLRIKTIMLKRGLALYQNALDALIGAILADGKQDEGAHEFAGRHWIDAAGMYMPKQKMDELLSLIEKGKIDSLEKSEKTLDTIYSRYRSYAYFWALDALKEILGHEPSQEEIELAITKGKAAAEHIAKLRGDDAQKESDSLMATGYGIDTDNENDRQTDFRTVRKLD